MRHRYWAYDGHLTVARFIAMSTRQRKNACRLLRAMGWELDPLRRVWELEAKS